MSLTGLSYQEFSREISEDDADVKRTTSVNIIKTVDSSTDPPLQTDSSLLRLAQSEEGGHLDVEAEGAASKSVRNKEDVRVSRPVFRKSRCENQDS